MPLDTHIQNASSVKRSAVTREGRAQDSPLAATFIRPLFLVLIFALGFFNAPAQTLDSPLKRQLEQEIEAYQQLSRERADELAEIQVALEQTSADFDARVVERDQLSQDLANLKAERNTLLSDIADLEAALTRTQGQIGELQDQLAALKARLESLMVSLYKQRKGSFARVLAQAESFHEVQVKNYYLSRMSEQDVALVTNLTRLGRELALAQQTLEQQIRERNTKVTALERTESELEAQRERLQVVINELATTREGQLATRQSLILEEQKLETLLSASRQQLEAEISALERQLEAARQAAAQAAAEAERQRQEALADQAEERLRQLSPRVDASEVGYVNPVADPSLLRAYGEIGPYILLQADQVGAAVRAVRSGIVREVRPVSANSGYQVAIEHLDGLITAYVNLQAVPLVSVNDQVAQGQIIGYLGGGSLYQGNVLRLYSGLASEGGRIDWIDPAELMGF